MHVAEALAAAIRVLPDLPAPAFAALFVEEHEPVMLGERAYERDACAAQLDALGQGSGQRGAGGVAGTARQPSLHSLTYG